MSAKKLSGEAKKTWIEIDACAIRKNCESFRKILAPRTRLWAVVKSNAYGHGLSVFSALAEPSVDGFCVDSVVEGSRLRREKIKKSILVLGPTLPALYETAEEKGIAVSVSSMEAFKALAAFRRIPSFHLKIDTGMHRQGFYPEDMPKIARFLMERGNRLGSRLQGVYTHFASAKDIAYPTYTDIQAKKFDQALSFLKKLPNRKELIEHCAATGGTFLGNRFHRNAVRIGMGLYGFYPSKELEIQGVPKRSVRLTPVLSWKALVSEVKPLALGDYVGYDLTERIVRPTKMAILPVGYWHGFSRSLSKIGTVLLAGRSARVLGRVSMDLICLDATGIPCRRGDEAVILGRAPGIGAPEVAERAGTTHYEFLTRLNPLIEKVVVGS